MSVTNGTNTNTTNTNVNLDQDRGVPDRLTFWAIGVGLFLAIGGAVISVFFTPPVPLALAALTLCVGFGIVLAAFGGRAAGSWGGFAVAGGAAVAIVLFLLLQHYLPADAPAFIKRGQMSGDFSKVADIRVIDEHPLYSQRDPTTRSIRFIILDRKLKSQRPVIQVDTTEKGEGREFFEMIGDGDQFAKRYLTNDSTIIDWTFDYAHRQVRDGSLVMFQVPDSLDEKTIGQPAPNMSFRLFDPIGTAFAQDRPGNADSLVAGLSSEDAAIRRNAREGLTALGPEAVPAMIAAFTKNPSDYRIKSGVITSLADILRKDEKNRERISQALTPKDFSLLVAATTDADPTLRLQATEFLYRLKDPRSADAVVETIKRGDKSDSGAAVKNPALVLKGVYQSLPAQEQARVMREIDAVAPASTSAAIKQLVSP
jgi:hypothetical protein